MNRKERKQICRELPDGVRQWYVFRFTGRGAGTLEPYGSRRHGVPPLQGKASPGRKGPRPLRRVGGMNNASNRSGTAGSLPRCPYGHRGRFCFPYLRVQSGTQSNRLHKKEEAENHDPRLFPHRVGGRHCGERHHQKRTPGILAIMASFVFATIAAANGVDIKVSKIVSSGWPMSVFFHRDGHHVPVRHCQPERHHQGPEPEHRLPGPRQRPGSAPCCSSCWAR